MLSQIKRTLYFTIASYFRFFAKIQLLLWKPQIVLITGSSGKTTLLHLIESQLQTEAKYSHHANSSYGIPFDILGLKRTTLTKEEWLTLFLLAPFKAFKAPPKQKLYIVEADCDRPHEGKFLASFLKPNITIWLDVSKTHSMNFDPLVHNKTFSSLEEAIAFEYGYFLQYCTQLAIINGDNNFIEKQLSRTKATVKRITKKETLEQYVLSKNKTQYRIKEHEYVFPFILPQESFYAVSASLELLKYLNKPIDSHFSHFTLPPGRNSVFKGIKETTIVDSSYNSNLSSATAILQMFEKMPTENKWVILGDMLEQGTEEKAEHEKLADVIASKKLNRIILMGPRISKYTYPKLKAAIGNQIILAKFENPKEVLTYLLDNIQGGETLLFKGARFLEGVIEHLLQNKEDIALLCRREKIWQLRRKKWGL